MSASAWSQVTWDVARAGGLMAYVLLSLSVALGLALSLRWQRPRWPRLITNDMHNFVAGLTLADRLHPNARAIEIVAERILPLVERELDRAATSVA